MCFADAIGVSVLAGFLVQGASEVQLSLFKFINLEHFVCVSSSNVCSIDSLKEITG